MSLASAAGFAASPQDYAAVLLRRCFISAQRHASELLMASFKMLVSVSPEEISGDWFELFKASVDCKARKHLEKKPAGPWDVFTIYDTLHAVLPKMSLALRWKEQHLILTKNLARDIVSVLNTRNWWAHKPVSVEMVCSAVEALQDSMSSMRFFLHTDREDFPSAALCEDELKKALKEMRAHETSVQLSIDDVAYVMLTQSFHMLCEGSRLVVTKCRQTSADKHHLTRCYSCREQLCRCTKLDPNSVMRGTKDALDIARAHLEGEACRETVKCSTRVQSCVRDVGSLIKHFQLCEPNPPLDKKSDNPTSHNMLCRIGGHDDEIDVIGITRNRIFHGGSGDIVLLALSALICVQKIMEARKKMEQLHHPAQKKYWKGCIMTVENNRKFLLDHVKFPDAEALFKCAVTTLEAKTRKCEWLPCALSDFEVLQHALFGSVPVPTTNCGCKVQGWFTSEKEKTKVIDPILVDVLVKDTRFNSSKARAEVPATVLPQSDCSVIEVSQKLCRHFKSEFTAENSKASATAGGIAAGVGVGVGSSSGGAVSDNFLKYAQFYSVLQKLTGNTDDWTIIARDAEKIKNLLLETGKRFSEMLRQPNPPVTCDVVTEMQNGNHHWLLLQHLLFKHVRTDHLQEAQECPCRGSTDKVDGGKLSSFISKHLKDLLGCTDETARYRIISEHSAFLALLVELNGGRCLPHLASHICVTLSDEVAKNSKFLPLKTDICLVGRQHLIDRCCIGMQRALRVSSDSSDCGDVASSNAIFVQLLLGISGSGKTIAATEAVHKFQRLLEYSDHVIWVQQINGRSAREVDLDYLKFGLALSRQLRLVDGASDLEIKERLTSHLRNARYLIFADGVTEEGLKRLLEILPVSSAGCAVIGTYASLDDSYLREIIQSKSENVMLNYEILNCFSEVEVQECLRRCEVHEIYCQDERISNLLDTFKYTHSATKIESATEECNRYLPLAVRLFANWLSNQSKRVEEVVEDWKSQRARVMEEGVPEYIISLKGTVLLALQDLFDSKRLFESAKQLLAIVTICGASVPSSLFENWSLLQDAIPESVLHEGDGRLRALLRHLQSCTALVQVTQVDDASHFQLDMHNLVRDVLVVLIRKHDSPWYFSPSDRAHTLDLLEQHFSRQEFIFLKGISSSCSAILNHDCMKCADKNADYVLRVLKLKIQLRIVFVKMRSNLYVNDIADIYNLQEIILKLEIAPATDSREVHRLIIKGADCVAAFSDPVPVGTKSWTYSDHYLVDYDNERNAFRLRGSSLCFASSSKNCSLKADKRLWELFEQLCDELFFNSCQYRIVCDQFFAPLDVFMYSCDTVSHLKSRIAAHANLNAESLKKFLFFHNGRHRQILGDGHSLIGLGMSKDSLILMHEIDSQLSISQEVHLLRNSQQLQHAFSLIKAAARSSDHQVGLPKDAIEFVQHLKPQVACLTTFNEVSRALKRVPDANFTFKELGERLLPMWSQLLSTPVASSANFQVNISDSQTQLVSNLLSGKLVLVDDAAMKSANQRSIRVYFSADAEEFKFERDFLHQTFVPFMQQSCVNRGFQFIFNDAQGPLMCRIAADHGSDSLLKELEKCQSESSGIAYVACFSGKDQRSRVLPDSISEADYKALLEKVRASNSKTKYSDLDVLKTWFLEDLNSNDPESRYVLQPGLNDTSRSEVKKTIMLLIEQHLGHCTISSSELRRSIGSAGKSLVVSKCQDVVPTGELRGSVYPSDQVPSSTGETEIVAGLLSDVLSGDELSFFRDCCDPIIHSLSAASTRASCFSDLHMECFFHNNFASDRIRNFCGDGGDANGGIDSVKGVLHKIRSFFQQNEKHICVLHGPSGSGKTCMMAKSVEMVQQVHPADTAVIFRFIGASPRTGKFVTLLYDICLQLNQVYALQTSLGDVPIDKDLIQPYFINLLKRVGQQKKRLYVILDSLDQLKDDDDAVHSFLWLPHQSDLSGSSVYFLISTVSSVSEIDKSTGCNISELCNILADGACEPATIIETIEIPAVSNLEGMLGNIIKSSSRSRRRISDKQMQFVLRFLNVHSGVQFPLFLTIIAQNALSWHSYGNDPDPILPDAADGIKGTLQFEFCRLESKFGFELTSSLLSYLSLSVEGISELELCEVLCLDDYVVAEFLTKFKDELEDATIVRGVPSILVSMLIDSIRTFLTHRGVRDRDLLCWYHRQFLEACKSRYFSDAAHLIKRHSQLADFFIGKFSSTPCSTDSECRWLIERVHSLRLELKMHRRTRHQPFSFAFPDGFHSFFKHRGDVEGLNRRRCIEAVHHLIESNRLGDAVAELCSFEGISARIQCGEHFSMMMQFSRLLQLIKDVRHKSTHYEALLHKVDHFKRWLDSGLEFILQRPRLHTLVSCSMQPISSIARQELIAKFDYDSVKFRPFNDAFDKDAISNLLLYCPRAHNFDGKFMSLRYQRRSVTSVALSAKFVAVVFSKASTGKSHHVEIRSTSHSSVIDSFSLGSMYKKISAVWSVDDKWLAIACSHDDETKMTSTLFLWNSLSKKMAKSIPIPHLLCISWGKARDCGFLVACSSCSGKVLMQEFNFDKYEQTGFLHCSHEISQCVDNGRHICHIKQAVGCQLVTESPLCVLLWGPTLDDDYHKLFMYSPAQQKLPTEIHIDDRIYPRKNGDIFCVSFDYIRHKLMVLCTNGIATFCCLQGVKHTSNFYWDCSADAVYLLKVPHQATSGISHKMFFFHLRYPSNESARLSIWRAEPTETCQQIYSTALAAGFTGQSFACGHDWYASLVESQTESCCHITLWDIREKIASATMSPTGISIETSTSSTHQQTAAIFHSEANVTRLCWNRDSTIVASVGIASSSLLSDVVDFWEWGSWGKSATSLPVLSHMQTRIHVGEENALKSLHWSPNGEIVLIWVDGRNQKVLLDIYELAITSRGCELRRRNKSDWILSIQDVKLSSLSSCGDYLAVVGAVDGVSTVSIYNLKKTFLTESTRDFVVRSCFDYPRPKASIAYVDWCSASPSNPCLMVLVRSYSIHHGETAIYRLEASAAAQWEPSLIERFDAKVMSEIHSFQLKCSIDGALIAVSCSGSNVSHLYVICVATHRRLISKFFDESASLRVISDMSWSVETQDASCSEVSKYTLAVCAASGEPPIALIFQYQPPIAFAFQYHHSTSHSTEIECQQKRIYRHEDFSPSLNIKHVAFSPNGKVLAAASSTESVQMFVNVDCLDSL